MTSERSCNTENCGTFRSFAISGINYILKVYFRNENSYFIVCSFIVCNNISQYCFYCIFDQMNAALVSMRLISQTLKILIIHNF